MNPTPTPTPNDNLLRVYLGGCWGSSVPSRVRAASRSSNVPASRFSYLGFRCALRGREPRV